MRRLDELLLLQLLLLKRSLRELELEPLLLWSRSERARTGSGRVVIERVSLQLPPLGVRIEVVEVRQWLIVLLLMIWKAPDRGMVSNI